MTYFRAMRALDSHQRPISWSRSRLVNLWTRVNKVLLKVRRGSWVRNEHYKRGNPEYNRGNPEYNRGNPDCRYKRQESSNKPGLLIQVKYKFDRKNRLLCDILLGMGFGGWGYINNTTTNLHGLESRAPLLQQLLSGRHPLRLVLRVPDS